MKKVFFLLIFAAVSFFLFSCDEKKEDDVYNTGDGENTQTVSNPKFSKQSGVYQEELSIEITTETKDASIYFTVDGTNPDDKSTLYSEPVNIPLETTTAIKAIAYKDKLKPSAVVSSNYEVTGVLDKPEFNIAPGVYTEPQSISLSHNDPEVIIRYTTDGTDPSSKSKTYSIPFSLVNESSTDIKAKAFKAKWGDSSTAQGLFVITGTVISPEFATEPGTYTEAKTITITCENPEAEIRYEVYNEDGGDDPTETSTLYTQPFLVPLDTTVVVKAKAFIPGWNPSPAITGKFVITGTVDLPVFSPIEGTYTSEQSVTISVPTEGAVVGYTVDGSDPTELSPLHSTPIVVPLNTQLLIKAKGFKKDWNPSPAVGGNYTVTGKVAAPAFSIIPNYYTSAQSVAITSTTQGASIKFTIDGSEPTKTHGNEYTGAVPIASTTTLKAIAYKTDWIDSNISEGTYNITGQVPAPVFSPVQGNYTNAQTVSLESNIPGITIRYTTDGSSPSRTAGTIYSGSFTVSSTTTVKAFAYRNDWETSSDSAVSNAVYTITGRASTPKFSVEPGNYTLTKTVALSTETTGAVIRYTVDGSDPSRTAGTLYSAGIVVDKPLTIKAVAYKSDWEESSNSEIATGIYNITGKVFAPVITPAETNHTNNVEVTLSSITSGAKIRFTTNGDTPTRVVGTLYTAPFSVSTGSTVKAIAYKDEWEESSNSDISSRAYVITGRVINPKFDIVPGNYTTGKTVKITTETTGTVIRYTLDGSVPSRTNGTIYTTAGIAINQTTTVKTIAYKTDWQESSNSDVITGTYTITGIVLAPEITPTQLNHTSSVTVSISSATTDASIRYTTNGIDPTPASGILYTDPFVISANSTVKAIAFRTDWEDSSKSTITSKVYTITGKVEKPKLSVEPGNYTSTVSLTLSCDTTGAKIRFTDDGSTPSRTAGTLYTAAISIPSTRTIKVIAYKDDWQDSSNSDVVSATYTITGKVVTPVMTPFTGNYTENTSVTIDTLTEDAVIRYTTNGTTPSRTNGLIYTGPILVNSTTTLKAFAYMTDWQITSDSDVVTGTFTITGKVANPLFSIEPGNYTASKDVTISTPTTGATIKYTLNGDQPSRDVGTIYTTKLTISSSTTVKAIAFKSDWQSSSDSNVVSALYNITGKVATPTINPAAQNNTDNVEVSISSLTEGAVIRYTTDGTNPTRSIGTIYGDPFTLSSSATVKAIAYKTDWEETSNSDIASRAYTITGKVVNPKFDILPGNYTTGKTVKITTETTGAVIRYTTDGSTPSRTNGTIYVTTGIPISETKTLKTIAYRTDWQESSDSDVITGLYTITGTVYAPVATPVEQNHTASVEVSLASITEGAVIRYTTDGTTNPTRIVGTLYENPFTVSATTTVKAIAYKPDWEETSNSTITSKVYTITGKVEKPKLSIEPGNYTTTVSLTLSCDTTGASMRYTIDGSDPTRTAGILYTGAISIPSTRTIKVIAYKTDWQESSNSDIVSGLYTITGKAATPVMSPIAGNYTNSTAVTITSDTTGAKIRYTTTGVNPTRSTGTLYTAPVQIDATATLKAIAYKDEWQSTSDSDVASGIYTITGKVVNPIFDITPGNYTTGKTVKITTETAGVVIRYTLDGTTPTRTNGTVYVTTGILLSETKTVKAVAYRTDWQESSDSDVITGLYTITGTVYAPVATPAEQNHTASVEVSLASITDGAVIRYTTDGTTNPTRVVGTLYENPFTVSATTTVKAIAYKPEWEETSNSTITSKVYTITGKVEKPKLSIEPGNYTATVSLTLSCDTAGAAMRYTIDGSDPTRTEGTKYTAAISIPSTRTIKVIAYKEDWQESSNSDIVSGLYTITGKAAAPVMSPAAGNYTNSTAVTLTSDTAGAKIRYTTTGVNPTRSTGTLYTAPVQIDATATLKAIAYKDEWQSTSDSDVASGIYTITGKVANPIITPQTGFYMSTQSVTISCATSGAKIKYTTDGSDPSEINGFLYTVAFSVASTKTVKAFAYKEEWQMSSDSDIISETLTITGKVVAPAFSPAGGKYTDGKLITITSQTQDISGDVVIRYSLDGSTPTRSSTLYTEPVFIGETKTLKAIAYVPQWEAASDSNVSTGSYTITGILPAPIITPPDGGSGVNSISVTITSVPGATIKYTTDGSDPSFTSGSTYSGEIPLTSSSTVKAMAYIADQERSSDSPIASATFTVTGNVAAPVLTASNSDPTPDTIYITNITTTTPEASIRYTIDGTNPSETNGTLYTGGNITIAQPTTVKAIAYKTDWTTSSITTVVYKKKPATPSFSIPGGLYNNEIMVGITSSTPDVTIYYTTNGSEPTTASTIYSDPVTINQTLQSPDNPLKAKAFKNGGGDGWVASDTQVASYIMQVGIPMFNVTGGLYRNSQNVEINTVTPDTEIRYGYQGVSTLKCDTEIDPSWHLEIYDKDTPLVLDTTCTLMAIACKGGWSPSLIAQTYIRIKAAAPIISPVSGTYGFPQEITIETTTRTSDGSSMANIFYTTDGSEPTVLSNHYTGPFSIIEPTIVKARTFKSSNFDSEVSTEVYYRNDIPEYELLVLSPEGNIQNAINSAPVPSIILIPEGIYIQTVSMKEGVSLKGESTEDVIIAGNNSNGVGINFPASVSALTFIENITVIGGGNPSETKGIYISIGAHPTIRNCIIDGGDGQDESYGIYNNGTFPKILNNTISGGTGLQSIAVFNQNSSGPLIKENSIYGGNSAESFGIYSVNSPALIISNLVESGDATSSTAIFNENSNNVRIFGNDIRGCSDNMVCELSYGIYMNSNSVVYVANNIIYGGSSSTSSYGIYNKSKDLVVSNNTISGGSAPLSVAIYNYRPTTSSDSLEVFIKNNILYTENNIAGTFCLYELNTKSYFTIVKNNNFFNCQTLLLKEGTSYITNINTVNSFDGMSSNLDQNPFFDLDLRPDQPLLYNGLNLFKDHYFPVNRSINDSAAIDIEGIERPSLFTSLWWIGAYEM